MYVTAPVGVLASPGIAIFTSLSTRMNSSDWIEHFSSIIMFCDHQASAVAGDCGQKHGRPRPSPQL